jgi:hypothetical protein
MKVAFSRTAAALGCAAAAAALIFAGAGTASANTIDEWFPTYGDCLTQGNILAQQGIIHGYSCTAENGGYVLSGS